MFWVKYGSLRGTDFLSIGVLEGITDIASKYRESICMFCLCSAYVLVILYAGIEMDRGFFRYTFYVLPMCFRCTSDVLPMCFLCTSDVLHICFLCAFDVLPMYSLHTTDAG